MKHHLVTLACTAAGAIAALAAGLLLGPSPAEQPAAPAAPPTVLAAEAKADRLPLVRRYPEAPRSGMAGAGVAGAETTNADKWRHREGIIWQVMETAAASYPTRGAPR
jgi:hypothetical protein